MIQSFLGGEQTGRTRTTKLCSTPACACLCFFPRQPVHGEAAEGGQGEEGVPQDDVHPPGQPPGNQGGQQGHCQDPQQPRPSQTVLG